MAMYLFEKICGGAQLQYSFVNRIEMHLFNLFMQEKLRIYLHYVRLRHSHTLRTSYQTANILFITNATLVY